MVPKRGDNIYELPAAAYKFQTPCRILISGQTMAGKSQMIEQLLRHNEELFSSPFEQVLICLPAFHADIDFQNAEKFKAHINNVDVRVGLPQNWEDYAHPEKHTLCVIDDMSADMYSNPALLAAITAHSHHLNISFIMTTQNYYTQGKFGTTIRANCSDFIFMEDKGNTRILKTIGSQIFPETPNILTEAMRFCIENAPRGVRRSLHLEKNPLSDLPLPLRLRMNFLPLDKQPYTPIYFTTE